jgi:hypothetical protein
MSVLFLAAMMMAQAPAGVEPASRQPVTGQQILVEGKRKLVCEYLVVTGSRSKQRVCADENGTVDRPVGVSNGAPNAALLHQAPSGSGETPGQGLNPG